VQIKTDRRYKDFKIIFECISGSHLYGVDTPESDVDIRGVFIPPKEYLLGFLHRVEQIEEHKQDVVHYDFRKFMKLAADCNPNIVELLFVPENSWQITSPEWATIITNRHLFLSTKARWTFSGYATSQLHRIKGHRNWLLNPPKKIPEREDFDLPRHTKMNRDILNEVETSYKIDLSKQDLPEEVAEVLPPNIITIIRNEKRYQNAMRDWKQYQNWKATRNPDRAKLEEAYGYDTKHGSHLYRLVTEGEEFLTTGYITFPRPDREIILDIRNGRYSYDQLLEKVGDIDQRFEPLYENSPLPHKAKLEDIDTLCINLAQQHLFGG